jgi:hypothetical protein
MMQLAGETAPKPNKQTPGSEPVKSYKHELFARSMALNMPVLECARRAGYDVMTKANAHKIARRRDVMDRVNYLAGNTDEVIRRKRIEIEREVGLIAYANMDDFVKISDNGSPHIDLSDLLSLTEPERRSLMAAVKAVRTTKDGVTLELHGKLEALEHLRKMNGIDPPQKTALTDPEGKEPMVAVINLMRS